MSIQDGKRKITTEHTKKLACVYARVSTLRGVKENLVGWERQREEAIKLALELGWSKENIRVFDEDHRPLSGTTTEGRYGYMEMLDDVIGGRVGAVLSLEPARVGRDSADWHILIKMSALTGTLVIDPHGIYDPNDPNDNTKMKFDALFVEVELRWIAQRLQGAKMALAAKGELRFFLPIGYVYDEDKKIILDPNEDVQKMVHLVFTLFRQLGSASKVARYLHEKGLKFPTYVRGGPRAGQYDWIRIGCSRVCSILQNPAYAGTYVFGRSKVKKKAVRKQGEAPKVVKYQEKLKRSDWQFVFHDAHPAYITWAEFLENEQCLKNNNNNTVFRGKATGAPREGSALLQGLALCGKCGRRMHVAYPHTAYSYYACQGERTHFGGKTCQTLASDFIDYAVEQAFLEALQPAQLEMSLQALEQSEQQTREIDQQWNSRLQRSEKAVVEAEERLLATDHKNQRAYARVQEHFEKKQAELDLLKQAQEEETKSKPKELSTEERRNILALAQDFPRVWNNETMDMATRKNLLRCLIADVTIARDGPKARVGIRWKTGAQMPLMVALLTKPSGASLPPEVIDLIKKLSLDRTDGEIATALNEAGIPNGKGLPFTKKRVKRIRERYELKKPIKPFWPERREDGRFSSPAVARMVGIPHSTVCRWCKEGRLDGVQNAPKKRWWIKTTPEELAEFKKTIRRVAARKKSENRAGLTPGSVQQGDTSEMGPNGVAL
jgi:DNA invertase Pin-like site-specific DNA recombinase